MQEVSNLINLLGGTGKVAQHLNIKSSAVSNWKKTNKIPNNKKEALKILGIEMKVKTNDFFSTKNFTYLKGNILLIISGGIACYKSLEIIRLIKKVR